MMSPISNSPAGGGVFCGVYTFASARLRASAVSCTASCNAVGECVADLCVLLIVSFSHMCEG